MPTRVLVIDDDAQARALVTALPEPAGYEVRSMEAGTPGLRLAADEPPDIIVLDVQIRGCCPQGARSGRNP